MSKKTAEKLETDLDFDDFSEFDDLDDFDFGDIESGIEPGKDDRTPVRKLSTSFVEGVRDEFIDGSSLPRKMKEILPEKFSSTIDLTDDTLGTIGNLYNSIGSETRKGVREFKKASKKAIAPISDRLPEKLRKRLENFLETADEYRSPSQAELNETEITDNLSEIFALQKGMDDVREEREGKERAVRDVVERKRFKSEIGELYAIRQDIHRQVTYQDQVTARYQRKSLELQYRQFFIARDHYVLAEQTTKDVKEALQTLVKNTALPEFRKTELLEASGGMLRDKFLGKVQGGIGDLINGNAFISKVKDNLGKKVKEKAQGVGSFLEDTAAQMGMLTESEVKLDPYAMAGQTAGSAAGSLFFRKLSPKLRKYLEANPKVAQAALRANQNVKDLPRRLNRWLKEDHGYGAIGDFLNSLTENQKTVGLSSGIESEGIESSRDASFFDKLTRKSIVEIIPGYLSRIHHELETIRRCQGCDDPDPNQRLTYSLKDQSFLTESANAKKVRDSILKPKDLAEGANRLDDIYAQFGLEGQKDAEGKDIIDPKQQEAVRKILQERLLKDFFKGDNLRIEDLLDEESYGLSTPDRGGIDPTTGAAITIKGKKGADPEVVKALTAALRESLGYIETEDEWGNKSVEKRTTDANKNKDIGIRDSFNHLRDNLGDPKGLIQAYHDTGHRDTLESLNLTRRDAEGNSSINYEEIFKRMQSGGLDYRQKLQDIGVLKIDREGRESVDDAKLQKILKEGSQEEVDILDDIGATRYGDDGTRNVNQNGLDRALSEKGEERTQTLYARNQREKRRLKKYWEKKEAEERLEQETRTGPRKLPANWEQLSEEEKLKSDEEWRRSQSEETYEQRRKRYYDESLEGRLTSRAKGVGQGIVDKVTKPFKRKKGDTAVPETLAPTPETRGKEALEAHKAEWGVSEADELKEGSDGQVIPDTRSLHDRLNAEGKRNKGKKAGLADQIIDRIEQASTEEGRAEIVSEVTELTQSLTDPQKNAERLKQAEAAIDQLVAQAGQTALGDRLGVEDRYQRGKKGVKSAGKKLSVLNANFLARETVSLLDPAKLLPDDLQTALRLQLSLWIQVGGEITPEYLESLKLPETYFTELPDSTKGALAEFFVQTFGEAAPDLSGERTVGKRARRKASEIFKRLYGPTVTPTPEDVAGGYDALVDLPETESLTEKAKKTIAAARKLVQDENRSTPEKLKSAIKGVDESKALFVIKRHAIKLLTQLDPEKTLTPGERKSAFGLIVDLFATGGTPTLEALTKSALYPTNFPPEEREVIQKLAQKRVAELKAAPEGSETKSSLKDRALDATAEVLDDPLGSIKNLTDNITDPEQRKKQIEKAKKAAKRLQTLVEEATNEEARKALEEKGKETLKDAGKNVKDFLSYSDFRQQTLDNASQRIQDLAAPIVSSPLVQDLQRRGTETLETLSQSAPVQQIREAAQSERAQAAKKKVEETVKKVKDHSITHRVTDAGQSVSDYAQTQWDRLPSLPSAPTPGPLEPPAVGDSEAPTLASKIGSLGQNFTGTVLGGITGVRDYVGSRTPKSTQDPNFIGPLPAPLETPPTLLQRGLTQLSENLEALNDTLRNRRTSQPVDGVAEDNSVDTSRDRSLDSHGVWSDFINRIRTELGRFPAPTGSRESPLPLAPNLTDPNAPTLLTEIRDFLKGDIPGIGADVRQLAGRGAGLPGDSTSNEPQLALLSRILETVEGLGAILTKGDKESWLSFSGITRKTGRILGNVAGGLGAFYAGGLRLLGGGLGGAGALALGGGKAAGKMVGGLFSKKAELGPRDVYIKDRYQEPVLTARDMEEGLYTDSETGKQIRKVDDLFTLKGDVLKEGNIAVSAKELSKGIFDRTGNKIGGDSAFKKLIGGLGSAIASIGRGYGALFSIPLMAIKGLGHVAAAGWRLANRVQDVCVKGEEPKPRLLATVMKNGGYVSAKTKKPIYTYKEIDGDIEDLQGNVVLSLDDMRKGLVTKQGKSLSFLMRQVSRLWGLVKLPFKAVGWVGRKIGAGVRAVGRGIRKGVKAGYEGVKDAVVGSGKLLAKGGKAVLDGLSGIGSRKVDKVQARQLRILTEIRDVLKDRLPKPKHALGSKGGKWDTDGDGDRDGSWQDIFANRKKRKAGEQTGKAAKEPKEKKDSWLMGLLKKFGPMLLGLGSMIATAVSGGISALASGIGTVVGGAVSALATGIRTAITGGISLLSKGIHSAAEALGNGARAVLESAKTAVQSGIKLLGETATKVGESISKFAASAKETLKAGWDKAKNLAKAGKEKVVKAAKTGFEVLKKGGRAVLQRGGQLARAGGQAVMRAGGRVLAQTAIRSAAMAAGSLLSAPVLLTAAAVAVVGIGGYLVWKHYQKQKQGEFAQFRFLQYGIPATEEARVAKVLMLEDRLKGKTRFAAGEFELDEDIDYVEIAGNFGVDPKDPEQVDNFVEWLNGRFLPVNYLAHASLAQLKEETKLEDLEKLSDSEKLIYLKAIREVVPLVPEQPHPYEVTTSPFGDETNLPVTKQQIEAMADALQVKFSQSAGGNAATPLSVVKNGSAETLANVGKVVGTTAATATSPLAALSKTGTATAQSQALLAQRINTDTRGTLMGEKVQLHYTTVGRPRVLTTVESVLLKAYGLKDYDPYKTAILLALQNYVLERAKVAVDGTVEYKGTEDEVFEAFRQDFGISRWEWLDEKAWRKWFRYRFLKVFLTFLNGIRDGNDNLLTVYSGIDKHPELVSIAAQLAVSVYVEIGDDLPVAIWTLTDSPWSDYTLNSEPSSVYDLLVSLKALVVLEPLKTEILTKPETGREVESAQKTGESVDDWNTRKAAERATRQAPPDKAGVTTPVMPGATQNFTNQQTANATGNTTPNAIGTVGTPVSATGTSTDVPASASGKTLAQGDWTIGQTSKKYESSKGGAGTISSGAGDHGGQSYGLYQMSLTKGTVHRFLKATPYGKQFAGLTPGTEAFNARWKAIAQSDSNFGNVQHEFIKTEYYDKLNTRLKKAGMDLSSKGPAVQDMIWSTAVQFGNINIVENALKGKDIGAMSDADIINAVQDYKYSNNNRIFKSSPKLWSGLLKRAKGEKADLLELAKAHPNGLSGTAATASSEEIGKGETPPTAEASGAPTQPGLTTPAGMAPPASMIDLAGGSQVGASGSSPTTNTGGTLPTSGGSSTYTPTGPTPTQPGLATPEGVPTVSGDVIQQLESRKDNKGIDVTNLKAGYSSNVVDFIAEAEREFGRKIVVNSAFRPPTNTEKKLLKSVGTTQSSIQGSKLAASTYGSMHGRGEAVDLRFSDIGLKAMNKMSKADKAKWRALAEKHGLNLPMTSGNWIEWWHLEPKQVAGGRRGDLKLRGEEYANYIRQGASGNNTGTTGTPAQTAPQAPVADKGEIDTQQLGQAGAAQTSQLAGTTAAAPILGGTAVMADPGEAVKGPSPDLGTQIATPTLPGVVPAATQPQGVQEVGKPDLSSEANSTQAGKGDLISPLKNESKYRVSSPFGPRIHPTKGGNRMHKGVDLATPSGTPIYAPADGTAKTASQPKGAGNYITLDHGNGVQTKFFHLSKFAVQTGQVVKQGELLGYTGNTGIGTGAHLHFEVWRSGQPVNPQSDSKMRWAHGKVGPVKEGEQPASPGQPEGAPAPTVPGVVGSSSLGGMRNSTVSVPSMDKLANLGTPISPVSAGGPSVSLADPASWLVPPGSGQTPRQSIPGAEIGNSVGLNQALSRDPTQAYQQRTEAVREQATQTVATQAGSDLMGRSLGTAVDLLGKSLETQRSMDKRLEALVTLLKAQKGAPNGESINPVDKGATPPTTAVKSQAQMPQKSLVKSPIDMGRNLFT